MRKDGKEPFFGFRNAVKGNKMTAERKTELDVIVEQWGECENNWDTIEKYRVANLDSASNYQEALLSIWDNIRVANFAPLFSEEISIVDAMNKYGLYFGTLKYSVEARFINVYADNPGLLCSLFLGQQESEIYFGTPITAEESEYLETEHGVIVTPGNDYGVIMHDDRLGVGLFYVD